MGLASRSIEGLIAGAGAKTNAGADGGLTAATTGFWATGESLTGLAAGTNAVAVVSTFGEVSGDRLKRVPTGYTADHPGAELLKLKDVTFGRPLADSDVLAADLPARIAETLSSAGPILRLLAGLPGHESPAGWLRD